jgi:hypothetical protein
MGRQKITSRLHLSMNVKVAAADHLSIKLSKTSIQITPPNKLANLILVHLVS